MALIPIDFSGYQPPASIHNKAAEFIGGRLALVEDTRMLPLLEAGETEIVKLSDTERALFADAVAPIVDDRRAIFGNELFDCLG